MKVLESSKLDERPPPLLPELIEHEVVTRDEQNLKKGEVNEPLELVALDKAHPEATMRIGTKMEPKVTQ